jgi:hypothetical protein
MSEVRPHIRVGVGLKVGEVDDIFIVLESVREAESIELDLFAFFILKDITRDVLFIPHVIRSRLPIRGFPLIPLVRDIMAPPFPLIRVLLLVLLQTVDKRLHPL